MTNDTTFEHAVSARVAGDYPVGEPTQEEIEAINARCALVPQRADELFRWSFVLSNTETDSHGTWMDETSVRNYARDANTGRGVPYLRHHDVYHDEAGRVFRGEIVEHDGQVSASRSEDGGLPLARDVLRDPAPALTLVDTAYLVRDLSGDLVRRIESGIAASNSVGFSVYTPMAPGSYVECDICRVDLFERDREGRYVCDHLPGLDAYVERRDEDEDEHELLRVIATARVVNARCREASGVYLGSTPGTFTLAARAHELYEAGRVSERDAVRLEDRLQLQRGLVTVGRPERLYSVGGTSMPVQTAMRVGTAETGVKTVPYVARIDWSDGRTAKDELLRADGCDKENAEDGDNEQITGGVMDYDAEARALELLKDSPTRLAVLELLDVAVDEDPVGAVFQVLTDELDDAAQDYRDLLLQHDEFKRMVRDRLGLDDEESIADGIGRVVRDAEAGRDMHGEAVEEMLKQMTRAGLDFDADAQRALAGDLPLATVRQQAEMYREAANRQFTPGRVSDPSVDDDESSTNRVNPGEYA